MLPGVPAWSERAPHNRPAGTQPWPQRGQWSRAVTCAHGPPRRGQPKPPDVEASPHEPYWIGGFSSTMETDLALVIQGWGPGALGTCL